MPPDSVEIDKAILAKLGGDAQLRALMPNGVFWGIAPAGMKQFVIVSLIDHDDVRNFEGRAYEDALYEVRVTELSSVPTFNSDDAIARIDALLDNQPLTVTGYSYMVVQREHRDRHTEPNEAEPKFVWFHYTGQYRVVMST